MNFFIFTNFVGVVFLAYLVIMV